MTEIRKFNGNYVEAELAKLGGALKTRVNIYLIGGCSMILRGLKPMTKDVDIVVMSQRNADSVNAALCSLGYIEQKQLSLPYKKLHAECVFQNLDGFQIDLFLKTVCGQLEVSQRMVQRAKRYKTAGMLDVHLIAPEDIFLFKSITERRLDLDDMRMLAQMNLNWTVVKSECLAQAGKNWAAFLVVKLDELKDEYDIDVPLRRELKLLSGDEMTKKLFVDIIQGDNKTINEISNAIKQRCGYSKSWTRKILKELVGKGILRESKQGNACIYSVNTHK